MSHSHRTCRNFIPPVLFAVAALIPRISVAQRVIVAAQGGQLKDRVGTRDTTALVGGASLTMVIFGGPDDSMSLTADALGSSGKDIEAGGSLDFGAGIGGFATAFIGFQYREIPGRAPPPPKGTGAMTQSVTLTEGLETAGLKLRFGPMGRGFVQGRVNGFLDSGSNSIPNGTDPLQGKRAMETRVSAGYLLSQVLVRAQWIDQEFTFEHRLINSAGQYDRRRQMLTIGLGYTTLF